MVNLDGVVCITVGVNEITGFRILTLDEETSIAFFLFIRGVFVDIGRTVLVDICDVPITRIKADFSRIRSTKGVSGKHQRKKNHAVYSPFSLLTDIPAAFD